MIFYAHKGNSLLSRAIRLFSPKYNHISIRIGQTIYEAHIHTGVRKVRYSKWEGRKSIVAYREIKTKEEKRVRAFLEKQVGKKYDTLGIIGFIWGLIPPKKDKWYCSELAKVALYKALGIRSTAEDYNQRVSPYQFWRELSAIYKII